MADNFFRTAKPGPLFLTTSANNSTIFETGVRTGSADADANPYMSSGGITKYPLIKAASAGADLVTDNLGGFKFALGCFVTTNLATNIATVAQKVAGVAGMTQIAVPWAGSVIGVAACANAAITAGTARFNVTVNGATVFSAVNSATGTKVVYGTQAKDTDTFSAGDRIGIKATTSTDLAPATAEWTMYPIVEV